MKTARTAVMKGAGLRAKMETVQCPETVRHRIFIKSESEVQRSLQITGTPWKITTGAILQKIKCLIITLLKSTRIQQGGHAAAGRVPL
jgi:hypothetical protein